MRQDWSRIGGPSRCLLQNRDAFREHRVARIHLIGIPTYSDESAYYSFKMSSTCWTELATSARRRATALIHFLCQERRHRAIRESERSDLELLLVVSIITLMILLYCLGPNYVAVVLNLFFLPVTISAFYLGRRRAAVAAVLCIVAAVFVFVIDAHTLDVPHLISWASVVVLSALCVGTLSDEFNSRFKEVYEAHVSETRTDALTNIANRRSFDGELTRQFSKWKADNTQFSLAFVDIDHFKRLNDNYGHQVGDKMLHDMARSLETTIRKTDFVARYGGEEFAIVMPNTSRDKATEIAERVRSDVEATRFFHQRAKLRMTISIGVTDVCKGDDEQSMIGRADQALYASKQAGRNCIHVQTPTECSPYGNLTPLNVAEETSRTQTPQSPILDGITNLPKREVFMGELSRRICEANRYGREFAVGIVKVDSIAELEEFGSPAVNRALNIVSELIRNVIREPDLIVRHSLDTFAILMPATSADQGEEALARLQREITVCDSVRHKGRVFALTARTTVSQPSGDSATNIMARMLDDIELISSDPEFIQH